MNQKRCSRCKQDKPLSEFNKGTRGDGYHYYCTACQLEYNKEWRKTHPEQVQEWKRKGYQAHKDHCNERSKRWAEKNPEKRKDIARRYSELHPDSCREAVKKWRHEHPEKVWEYGHRRQGLETGASGSYTYDEWIALCNQYNNQCVWCGDGEKKLTPDHIVPLSKSGSNDIKNIQPLCISCNSKKSTQTIRFIE